MHKIWIEGQFEENQNSDFTVVLWEKYEYCPEPVQVYVNDKLVEVDYFLDGEVVVKTFGWTRSLALEQKSSVLEILNLLQISPDDKTVKISFEGAKSILWILVPIQGAAPFQWNNHKWFFHKTDPDPWPSEPHGHCYEKNKVINPFTGEIFDPKTRRFVGNIGKKGLAALQNCLSQSKDFQCYFVN